MKNTAEFYIPTREYGPIDSLNRRAAAVGSPRYAAGAAGADYNGHHVVVSWNDYRGYYICEYTWAGRRVLARGSFAACLGAALAEYRRGALGATVSISVPEGDGEAIAELSRHPEIKPGLETELDWYTWRHKCAALAARDSANPRAPVMIFDWELMQNAEDEPAYNAALIEKYGRAWI